MIVKMKKASFIFLDDEKDRALDKIREAGVIHLEQEFRGSNEKTASLKTLFDRFERAYQILDPKVKTVSEHYSSEEANRLCDKVHTLLNSRKEGEEKRIAIASDLVKWEPWGDFDPSEVSILRSRGVDLGFYQMNKTNWALISKEYRSFTVSTNKTSVYGIIAITGDESFPEAEPLQLPGIGVSELKRQDEMELKNLAEIDSMLESLAIRRDLMAAELKSLQQDLQFESLLTGLGNDTSLVYFSGYVPAREGDALKSLTAENGWALVLSDPLEEDNVPTLVENNKVVGLIKPLFNVLEVLPGYREMDISKEFLIFFTLFFAMIIGDAGYGVLLLGITAFVHIKKRKGNAALSLLYLLSFATVIWGSLTGTWFGSQTLGGWAPLKNLVLPSIASFPQFFEGDIDSSITVKYMCFVIATIQLSIARLKNFMNKMPSLVAFEQLGWLSMLIGVYHIVLLLVLSMGPVPQYALNMIGGGLITVIVFGKQEKGVNFFKAVLKGLNPIGLFTLFLDSISLLSDIISYIRLFAVGLASLAIASSFNAMAAPMMEGPAIIGAILILLLGHGLNIAMGALSLIVHGVRLNMLEFSGHLDMEWSGIKYEPFSKALRP
jgi:V/A-type H+-transporting ATPase subunit I